MMKLLICSLQVDPSRYPTVSAQPHLGPWSSQYLDPSMLAFPHRHSSLLPHQTPAASWRKAMEMTSGGFTHRSWTTYVQQYACMHIDRHIYIYTYVCNNVDMCIYSVAYIYICWPPETYRFWFFIVSYNDLCWFLPSKAASICLIHLKTLDAWTWWVMMLHV